MKKTKKVLALVLSIVMLLSALPTAVFAAENEAEYAFSDSMQAFLSLESIVQLNVGFKLTADGADLSAAEAAALQDNVGLLVWKGETAPADAAIETCDVVLGAVYNAAKGRYEVKTDGIPAKELGDALCFMPYYTDGMEYTYGRMIEGYSPKEYCYGQIAAGGSDTAVNAAILNYGAAAQEYFAYNTENLMNADLTEEQKALNWDGSLVRSEWAVPAEKEGELSRGAQIASRGGYLSLEGTIDVNFYFGADMDVADAEVLLWTEYAYNAAEVLAEENASLVKELTWNAEKSRYEYKYEGIAAKEMFSPVYACAKFTDAEGNVCYSGVVAYCAERYAYIAQNDADPALADLAKRIAIYGDAARTYFGNVELPDVGGGNQPEVPGINTDLTADVELTADGTVASEVSMSNGEVGATVPAGVAADKTTLTLQVSEKASSDADVEAGENETALSLDVHVDGVSASNTTAIIVKLGEILPKALNIGNVALYHVENGVTNEMTRVMTMEELDAHNEYYYDPVTGEVYVALASFSEVTVMSTDAVWEGGRDYGWYNADAEELLIANADQLAAFGAIVGGMNGQTRDSFAGQTVKLIADIDLNDAEKNNTSKIFHPIGYYYTDDNNNDGTIGDYYSTVYSFEGTFDGNGHTISNFYQNTWEIKGDYEGNYYCDAMGLFGYVVNGTVKNLTVDNFSSDGEFTMTGCVAAYAAGECLFENLAITNCNPRVYNTGNGGIIGIAGESEESTKKITLRNITVDQTNKISALWGSYDVACGGLVGRFRGYSPIVFENCHVAAIMDVANDVCANYQYYWYRYSGMMIGSVHTNETEGNYTVADISDITVTNCTYTLGDWNQYWYCELVKNSLASYTHDHQFSRLTRIEKESDIQDANGNWNQEGNFVIPNADNTAAECYHIFKNSEGNLYQHSHDVADESNPNIYETFDLDGNGELDDLKEDRTCYFIPFNQVLNGWGYGCKPTYEPNAFGVNENGEPNLVQRDDGLVTSDPKFAKKDGAVLTYTYDAENELIIEVGDLFESIVDDTRLSKTSVYAAASPATEADTISATYALDMSNWEKSTLTFAAGSKGTARVVITDYFYCMPTVINITIAERQAAEKFAAKEVGEQNAYTQITLDKLFGVKDGATISGNVTATVTDPNGNETPVTGTSSDWTGKTIDLTKDGSWTVSIVDDDELCLPTEVTFDVSKVDKFTKKFDKDFLYRVGNIGTVELQYLFSEIDAPVALSSVSIEITNIAGTADGTYAAKTPWTSGSIQFSGTGVVKLTISADGANAVSLNLEVVAAKNTASASFSGNCVLLKDVSVTSTASASGVVYGNGFTINMENAVINEKNGAVFHLYDGGVLKNLKIVGKEFTTVAMQVNDTDYGVSAVRAWGTAVIENCYISGCRSAVSVTGTELTIKDSVIANGVYSNVDFRSGILNLHNVTTINEPHAVGDKTVVGLGIVGNLTASAGRKLNVTGALTQYNWVSQADCSNIKASGVSSIFNDVYTKDQYASLRHNYNGTVYVNTGILSLCSDFVGETAATGLPSNYEGMDVTATISQVTVNGYVWAPGYATDLTDADMAYHDKTYEWSPEDQGTSYIAPAFDFTSAGVEEESGVLQISYENGNAYTLSADTMKALLSPTKYGVALDCRITMNGTDYTNRDIVFDETASQTYTITYTVTDDLVYDKDGNLTDVTYEVTKDLKVFATVVDKTADAPTFTFYYGTNGSASAGTPHTTQPTNSYTSTIKQIGEEYYIMPNVSATTANAIGSQTVNNETVYYPIVDGINVRSGSSTDYDFTRYYPVFKAVKISDNGTEYSYSGTKEIPATVSWVSATIDSGNGASSLNDGFGLYNDQYLCKIQKKAGDAEGGGTSVVKFSYTALDGNTYCYYVGYRFYDEDEGGVCVTPDTLITLADGSQVRADALTGNEELLVWNHTTGAYDVAPIAYIVNHDDWYGEMEVVELTFSDGTALKIIGEHVFYDATENRYVAVTADDAAAYIGHSFARTDAAGETLKLVELVGVERSVYETNLYEIVTYKHLTCFTDNMLTASAYLDPLLNIFDIDTETFAYDPIKMQTDIETYGLYTYADFEGLISEEAFDLYNAAYLKIAVGKGYIDWNTILELIDIYFAVDVQPIG